MTLAKTLGGGVAIGAVCAKPEVAKSLRPGMHASTFGGNPLACAAGIAVFETIEKEQLLKASVEMGNYLVKKFVALKKKYSVIQEIRHCGLMVGVVLGKNGNDLVANCLKAGLIMNCTHDTVLRWIPAMTVKKKEIDEAMVIFERELKQWV